MVDDVQPDDGASVEPAIALLDAARIATPGWLDRITRQTANRAGVDVAALAADIDEMVTTTSSQVLDRLEQLLQTDVDEQTTNPLSLFRAAVAGPTAVLRRAGVAEPPSDAFVDTRFPADPYHLGPATWSDIDERMHEPGLVWGAWKAMTVLRRRRDEGLR